MKTIMPPNRVLTLEEVEELCHVDGSIVWLETLDENVRWACPGKTIKGNYGMEISNPNTLCVCHGKDYKESWRCWLRKPTDEERHDLPWGETMMDTDTQVVSLRCPCCGWVHEAEEKDACESPFPGETKFKWVCPVCRLECELHLIPGMICTGKNCKNCGNHIGGLMCKINLEDECAEGGGYEAWEPIEKKGNTEEGGAGDVVQESADS